MPSGIGIGIVLAASLAAMTAADYSKFFFIAKNTDGTCSTDGPTCSAPSVCALDSPDNRWYCCDSGLSSAVCWAFSIQCSQDTNLFTCNTNNHTFCCLRNSSTCTKTRDQFNVCWNELPNPVANVSQDRMDEVYSSISSRNPAASSFQFELAQVTGIASTTTSETTPTSATTSTSSSDSNSGNHLSGRSIAGIVVGSVLGAIIVAIVIGFSLKRHQQNKTSRDRYMVANENKIRHEAPTFYGPRAEMEGQKWRGHEVAGDITRSETGRSQRPVQELPANM